MLGLNKSFLGVLGVLAVLTVFMVAPAAAQDATPEATPDVAVLRVEVQAEDGLTLVGDLYNAQMNSQMPAILLMHMFQGNRHDWDAQIPAFTAQGYRVLNVDLRGHGESKGFRDWQKAITDVQSWLDWMESQPAIDADKIAIVGASVGANLALVGCAADTHCVTVVALSPAKDYFHITTSDAIKTLSDRSMLIMGSQLDLPSGIDQRSMTDLSAGEISVHLFAGQRHGLALFRYESVSPEIVNWLDDHLR